MRRVVYAGSSSAYGDLAASSKRETDLAAFGEVLTRHVVQTLFSKHFLHIAHFVLHLASDFLGCTSVP